ncbi:Paf1 complex subunit Cdc73, N-terminal domain [Cinara cedri]|uniref:Paf1 complex subunit Cdc73, N-terminal domain n=1 Tax=Cinara cedri TaxID=506608 RepID=A0A5E4MP33_9HEMI|nr:Paf1 complex subunit Cdc73, N-terminal domain [Cinara cedri]
MADPLIMLRMYNIDKKKIRINDNDILFGDLSWPKTFESNYFAYDSGKNGSTRRYYTLECLLFLLNNATLRHSEYVQQAKAKNVPYIRRPDRKPLLAYLSGESPSCDNIDYDSTLQNLDF